jgi:uncharacterized protein (DUF885 family)
VLGRMHLRFNGGRLRAALLHLSLVAMCISATLFLALNGRIGAQQIAESHLIQSTGVNERRDELSRLLAEEWEYELRESPEFATVIGDYRYNDRWSDHSLAHVQMQRSDLQNWLSQLENLDTTGFPEQEKLNQSLIARNLKERIDSIDMKNYEMPVDQFFGIQIILPELVAQMPFDSSKHYEDYLARLHQVPKLLDQVIVVLQQGKRDGLMQPRFLLANAFGRPASQFPDGIAVADRKHLHEAIVTAVDNEVRPAYKKLANFISKEYAPAGRNAEGVWSLPNGDARYRFAIRQMTSTDLEPEAIHRLGLEQVARIEGEQLAIAQKLGFSDLKTFRSSLKTIPKLVPASAEQLLDAYRGYLAQMEPQLPKWFGMLPKASMEIRPVQKFREKEAGDAEYQRGTPDGSRPGIVYVNTADFQNRSLWRVETTLYHEGIPGHHLQISTSQKLPALASFRRYVDGLSPFPVANFYNAYIEGWALYSERLGKDIGFFKDSYSDFGRLDEELFRADRLVLDTGVHYKHWTRTQMIDYLHQHSAADEPDVQAEVDRYIAVPGQALGYKLGEIEILKLRALAEKELGDRYDIRAFHDEILNGGALPLDVLDGRVKAWIAAQQQDQE